MALTGKKILLGVTGSIAAYKSVFLVRELIKKGAEVKVVMTSAAKDFVTPLTFSTISKNAVHSEFYSKESGSWANHVELGLWADVMIIAPVSANTISAMAHGLCNNLLLATYLSARCPVYFAPAMDLDMYAHPSTKDNIQKLISFGNILIDPGTGELASGLSGEGRMAEPEEIVSELEKLFVPKKLSKKKVLITAGPTYEAIDPVRFIGNHSSGKMGFALAESAAKLGAEVILITGPSNLQLKNQLIKRKNVVSAEEMHKATVEAFKKADIAILSAAVADYKPAQVSGKKIKKKDQNLSIELIPTIDILAGLGKHRKKNQLLVGFALETDNEEENARQKLQKKNLDLIVLNSLRDAGAGFSGDNNKISIIGKNNKIIRFELKSKVHVAEDILNEVVKLLPDA
jgi:phosphopantothenoylcysteine decarboxylase / phosphopantothenate---cysteine ligase